MTGMFLGVGSVKSGFGFASLLLGTQRDGERFVPDWRSATAVDYSCFTTNASTVSGLDVAVTHGGPVVGCCPKTAAGPPMAEDRSDSKGKTQRRVMFGWLQHGYMSVPRLPYENTIALPRDLSVVTLPNPYGGGTRRVLRQSFVPELKALRRGPPVKSTYASIVPNGSPLWVGSGGNQLEVLANFTVPRGLASGRFGLWVLANRNATERTLVEFDPLARLVKVDRRHSGDAFGIGNDSDVRAGPWPTVDDGSGLLATDLSVHIYVDRSIVELIVNGQTALTVYVHPSHADSIGLALFYSAASEEGEAADGGDDASGGGVQASVEAYELDAAPLTSMVAVDVK